MKHVKLFEEFTNEVNEAMASPHTYNEEFEKLMQKIKKKAGVSQITPDQAAGAISIMCDVHFKKIGEKAKIGKLEKVLKRSYNPEKMVGDIDMTPIVKRHAGKYEIHKMTGGTNQGIEWCMEEIFMKSNMLYKDDWSGVRRWVF